MTEMTKADVFLFGCISAVYVVYVRLLRRKRFNQIQEAATAALELRRNRTNEKCNHLAQNHSVNAVDTIHGIYHTISLGEMEFEAWISMTTRALLHTYAIPTISKVLYSTGGFSAKGVDRRYADMEMLIREFVENSVDDLSEDKGVESRARIALLRLNAIHNFYGNKILYRDMLYTLVIFMTSQAEWIDSWGWRDLTQKEKDCIYCYWVDVGKMLNLRPEEAYVGYDNALVYKEEYERKYMRYASANKAITESTIDHFLSRYPTFLQPALKTVALQFISCVQPQQRHIEALGLPLPSPVLKGLIDVTLTCRAYLCRWLLVPRSMKR